MLVLDTSALIYWLFNRAMLSPLALTTIQAASQIGISSISLWEIAIKQKKGKLLLPLSAQQIVERLYTVDRVQLIAVDETIWLRSVALVWEHSDPADRVIVASAQIANSPLLTNDRVITEFYQQTVW